MKLNICICLSLLSGAFLSCKRETIERFDMSDFKVAKVKLMANHTQLIADGISTITLNPMLFSSYSYKTPGGNDTTVYPLIKTDRMSPDAVTYFLEDGTPLNGPDYKTQDLSKPELRFYAIAEGVKSDLFTVKIRQPFADNEYNEIVYPVVFHIIQNKQQVDMKQGIDSGIVYYALRLMNQSFSREVAFSPNGADTKIRFRAAEYDPKGVKMAEKGINRYPLITADLNSLSGAGVLANPRICWDYKKYLNIWVIDGWGSSAGSPKLILQSADLDKIKGVTFTAKTESEIDAATFTMADIGLTFSARDFAIEDVSYSTQTGKFFGLLGTKGEDYCDDTFSGYKNFYPSSDIGSSRLKLTADGMPFYSVNIMDESSYQTTISMDQVKRARMITEFCPHRWAYKNTWAFTGQ